MLELGSGSSIWSFEPAIDLLRSAADGQAQSATAISPQEVAPVGPVSPKGGLGDFTDVWKHLGLIKDGFSTSNAADAVGIQLGPSIQSEATRLAKVVKWRDEQDGADLEDNVEPQQISAANLRTRKRAARRARARERELKALQEAEDAATGDTETDNESSEELESLRRSPDRRALIATIIGRPQPVEHVSPPTSPSPPKDSSIFRTPIKKERLVPSPFLWTAPGVPSPTTKPTITPIDGLTTRERKMRLISKLCQDFPQEQKYLKNAGLLEPAFSPLNTSPIGVHVFIDMSNISIGFHDCLKLSRGIPISTRTRRIPMDFHNLSLILERGRPTAKRVLCGSDRTQAVEQAETCGYETNVLDRVHKAKTPPSKKYRVNDTGSGSGYHSASGLSYGESSGSETPGYVSAPQTTYKWSEQAVDEILHLKMSHSILDADKPSTIVLATGDAAEAEYSDGFLRMVERALSRGWHVELCSFKLNTSSLYRRRDFRQKWGSMFKWIPLDEYAESMIYSER